MLFLKDEVSSVEDGSVFWLLGEVRASLPAGYRLGEQPVTGSAGTSVSRGMV